MGKKFIYTGKIQRIFGDIACQKIGGEKSPGLMGVAEGASGASADAPGVGLKMVSVSVCQWKPKLKTKKCKK